MNESKTETVGEEGVRRETCCCPFCLGRSFVHDHLDQFGDFFSHLNCARIEVLLAFKSLLEQRIAHVKRKGKRVTKIEVE
jgi:hypothetical protein